MKKAMLYILLILLPGSRICFAQATQTKIVEDFRPASSNQQGKLYPQDQNSLSGDRNAMI